MAAPLLLHENALSCLAQWLNRGSALFAFDFDGTLCPIVDDPDMAVMSTHHWSCLAWLAQRVTTAVVSGRGRQDLLKRVPQNLQYVVGNHGNEGLPVSGPDIDSLAQICQAWSVELSQDALFWLGVPGARMENKGLSLSLHYRGSPNSEAVKTLVLTRALRLVPRPVVIEGNCVVNFLPPGAYTKRMAVELLLKDCACEQLLFIGDDDTDELVFEEAPSNWFTIHVGSKRETAARYGLRDVQEVGGLLEWLTSALPTS